MSDSSIVVENIGKMYLIHHQDRERYTTLRDVLARGLSRLFRKPQSGGTPPFPKTHTGGGAKRAGRSEEEFWALKDVSFKVKKGEVIGIVGRNGAGKSTLLRILSRITVPTTGCFTLRGRVASLLEVGSGFHPELTGRENIYLNGATLGMSKIETRAKFDEIAAFAEVENFLDTPVKHYSSGMYMRLAFAVAAHLEPDILIIDEVLAVGDADFQKKCLGKMNSIAGCGRTILFVSHHLDTVRRLCTKAIVLDNGSISFAGHTDEALAHYQSAASRRTSYFPGSNALPHSIIKTIRIHQNELLSGNLLLEVEFLTALPLVAPSAGVVVYDERGHPIFGSNTLMHPPPERIASAGRGKFTFFLNNLPLNSGEYTLSFWLSDGPQTVEFLPSCLSFSYQDPTPPPSPTPCQIIGHTKVKPEWKFAASADTFAQSSAPFE